MANLSITYPNFVASTTIVSDQVDQNNSDIQTYINNRNSGSSTWDAMSVSATTTNPVTIASSASGTTEVAIDNTATDGDPIVTYKLSAVAKFAMGVDDSDSDKFKIAHASTLGTASTDDLIISQTTGAVSLRGTTTNDSASTGYVGEYVSATAALANVAATGTFGNVTSISLTAGDWDVSGIVAVSLNGATTSGIAAVVISAFSANTTTDHVLGDNQCNILPPSGTNTSSTGSVPNWRVSISSTTTIYLKVAATFSAGTPQATGRISARRVR